MSLQIMTAESSLYASTGHYRLLAGGVGTIRRGNLRSSCMETCMDSCRSDAATCRFECEAQCSPRPTSCKVGYKWCSGSGASLHCCPISTDCCYDPDPAWGV